MDKKFDVAAICNALVDVIIEVEEEELKDLGIKKGIMHLIDEPRQRELLAKFADKPKTIELGGSSLNAIRALAMLDRKTVFVGMVGEDDFGNMIIKRMQELKIEPKLAKSGEVATGSSFILVTPDGERTMNTFLGASCMFGVDDMPRSEIESAKVLHFCGYQWATESQKQSVALATGWAKESKTVVSFDLADPWVVEANREVFQIFIRDNADIVFANSEEARLLYGTTEDAAKNIADSGAVAVVKLGAKGAVVRENGSEHPVEVVETNVVDTTAAGDMFAGGFLHGFLDSRPLAECGKFGAHLAADVISRIGAHLDDEVIKRVQNL